MFSKMELKVSKNGDIYLIWQENDTPQKIKIPIEKFERIEAAAFEMYDLLSEIRRAAVLQAINPKAQEADNDA